MLIAITSDLHYSKLGCMRNLELFGRFLNRLGKIKPDVIVVCGDFTGCGYIEDFTRLVRIIRRASPHTVQVYVFGNHDLWLSKNEMRKGLDSLEKMEKYSRKAEEAGVYILDLHGPLKLEDVWLVGAVGWYDYSYASHLNFPYESFVKGTPYPDCEIPHGNIFIPTIHCPEWWVDKVRVRIPFSDEEFLEINVKKLEKQLSKAGRKTMLFLHHVPKRALLPYTGKPFTDFFRAYDSSEKLGAVAERFEVEKVFFGHKVLAKSAEINGVKYLNAHIREDKVMIIQSIN